MSVRNRMGIRIPLNYDESDNPSNGWGSPSAMYEPPDEACGCEECNPDDYTHSEWAEIHAEFMRTDE